MVHRHPWEKGTINLHDGLLVLVAGMKDLKEARRRERLKEFLSMKTNQRWG